MAGIMSVDAVTADAKPAAVPPAAAGSAPAAAVAADATPAPVADAKPAEIVYDLKLPEGYEAADAADVLALAKEHKLPPAIAQKMLDDRAAREAAYNTAFKAEQETRSKAFVQSLVDEARKDPEIGGEKFDASVARAKHVLSIAGDDAFRKDLDTTGLGNSPGLIRLLNRVAKMIGEDSPIRATAPAAPTGGQTSDEIAARFYGKSN